MARQRMLHPDFFTDPKVVSCSPLARLLFQGLWCLADRDGRLEGDLMALKLRVLPADNCDVGKLLQELISAGLVRAYAADSKALLYLPGFNKRQRPHPKEPASSLPPPEQKTQPAEIRPVVELHGEPRKEITDPSSKTVDPAESVAESESFPSESVAESGDPGGSRSPLPREKAAVDITPPDKPASEWLGDDFWRWFQSKRQDAGLIAERGPPRSLSGWYSTALSTVEGDVDALCEAVFRFGEDKFWQSKTPPLPWAGFESQWTKFVPRRLHAAT